MSQASRLHVDYLSHLGLDTRVHTTNTPRSRHGGERLPRFQKEALADDVENDGDAYQY